MTATKEEASMKYGDNAAIRIDRKKTWNFLDNETPSWRKMEPADYNQTDNGGT